MKIIKRNSCKECLYYHKTNNTCQSKKCATGGAGYVTWWDRLWCEPYKREWQKKGASDGRRLEGFCNNYTVVPGNAVFRHRLQDRTR